MAKIDQLIREFERAMWVSESNERGMSVSQPTPDSQEVERAREWMETLSSQHEDVYALLAAYHAHASAEERRRRQAGKTHWDGCWKDHLDCAVENVQRLVKAATEVERISSRDHNAWAELRSALAPFKEE